MLRQISLLVTLGILSGCLSGRTFWEYVIDDGVNKPLEDREKGTRDKPPLLSPYNVKVVYNDGSTQTQVLVPVLTSGQQIVIDHTGDRKVAASSLKMVPLPPTEADKSLEDIYLKKGLEVKKNSESVSIVKTHERIQNNVREGNYSLALQYAEKLLARYPNHVRTLHIKGSLLVKLGENDAAIEAYRRAQDIDPDEQVAEQIRKMENNRLRKTE